MTFHIFFLRLCFKNTLSETETIRKQQLKQLTDKITDIKVHTTLKCIKKYILKG